MKPTTLLLLSCCLILSYEVNGQCVCPIIQPSSDNHTIIINDTAPKVNGTALPTGSCIIALFNGAGGTLQPAGCVEWTNSLTVLPAIGNDGSNPPIGYAANEPFKFIFILPTGDTVNNIVISYVPPNGVLPTHSGNYASNGISQIQNMSGTLVTVEPCDTLVCDDGDPCTIDTCDNGACVFTEIICDD